MKFKAKHVILYASSMQISKRSFINLFFINNFAAEKAGGTKIIQDDLSYNTFLNNSLVALISWQGKIE